jgi:hypothetical protein
MGHQDVADGVSSAQAKDAGGWICFEDEAGTSPMPIPDTSSGASAPTG